MEYLEFRNSLTSKKGSISKVRNSYGVYDYFKYYRKTKPKDPKYVLTESQYFKVIRKIHSYLADEYIESGKIVFPNSMGSIELRKYTIEPKIDEDGKLKFKPPINWEETLKLWYSDPDTHKQGITIKYDNRTIYKTIYNRSKATYINQFFYMFTLNSFIKKRLSANIIAGNLDAFNLNKTENG